MLCGFVQLRAMRTQVGIIGAGPAGLMLAHLLAARRHRGPWSSRRHRDYVEKRVRAGVLEQGTVDLLARSGAGERLLREGLIHHGIELRFEGQGHRIAYGAERWPLDHRLRPAGSGQRPDRRAAGGRRGDPVRRRGSRHRGHRFRAPRVSFTRERRERTTRVRLHRRVRRLPRRLPRRRSPMASARVRPRLSVRLARHPRAWPPSRKSSSTPTATGLRAASHAVARVSAACISRRARRGDGRLAGRADLGGAPARLARRRLGAERGRS